MTPARSILSAAALMATAACAAVPAPEPAEPVERVEGLGSTCAADAGRSLIGETATAELGRRAQRLTGATRFRWAPPDSALTLDYRQDRLTVHYDRALRVVQVDCG